MEYHGNAISLDGKAFNPPAVANFIANLKLVPAFQEPKLADLSACSGQSGATLYCYKMSFTFSNLDRTQPETAAPPAGQAGGGPAQGRACRGRRHRRRGNVGGRANGLARPQAARREALVLRARHRRRDRARALCRRLLPDPELRRDEADAREQEERARHASAEDHAGPCRRAPPPAAARGGPPDRARPPAAPRDPSDGPQRRGAHQEGPGPRRPGRALHEEMDAEGVHQPRLLCGVADRPPGGRFVPQPRALLREDRPLLADHQHRGSRDDGLLRRAGRPHARSELHGQDVHLPRRHGAGHASRGTEAPGGARAEAGRRLARRTWKDERPPRLPFRRARRARGLSRGDRRRPEGAAPRSRPPKRRRSRIRTSPPPSTPTRSAAGGIRSARSSCATPPRRSACVRPASPA